MLVISPGILLGTPPDTPLVDSFTYSSSNVSRHAWLYSFRIFSRKSRNRSVEILLPRYYPRISSKYISLVIITEDFSKIPTWLFPKTFLNNSFESFWRTFLWISRNIYKHIYANISSYPARHYDMISYKNPQLLRGIARNIL